MVIDRELFCRPPLARDSRERRLATAIIAATAAMIATGTIVEGVRNLRTCDRAS